MIRSDFSSAPEILTPRLRLRGHRPDDLAACQALWGDIDVVRHISARPATREETWARLLRYAGHWRMLGFGYWILQDRDTGAVIGEVGLADYRREIEPSLEGHLECGWLIAPKWHGQGLASEAVRAVLAWGEANLARPCVACMISPDNSPSLRLAERLGFRLWTQTTYGGNPMVLFRRDGDAGPAGGNPATEASST